MSERDIGSVRSLPTGAGLVDALPEGRTPWTYEAAPLAGYYVLDADGRLMTWTNTDKFAERVVKAAEQRDAERERGEVVREPDAV